MAGTPERKGITSQMNIYSLSLENGCNQACKYLPATLDAV